MFISAFGNCMQYTRHNVLVVHGNADSFESTMRLYLRALSKILLTLEGRSATTWNRKH